MTLRELLRYEVWSKQTTRRILVGSAILAALLFVGYKIWDEVESHWLTRSERTVAKAALQRIDALQNSGPLSDEEFDNRTKDARLAIDAAERAARTRKDELVYMELAICAMGPVSARMKAIEQRLIEQGKLRETPKEFEWSEQGGIRTDDLAHRNCLYLHKQLD
jgi:hypothetical protein